MFKRNQMPTTHAPSGIKDFRFNKGKLYYLSFSRTRASSYFKDFIDYKYGNATVIFKLDGRLLGSKFKAIPVDYFYNGKAGGQSKRSKGRSEAEDRIITDKPSIRGFKRFILSIDVIDSSEWSESDEKIADIIRWCADDGIPIKCYESLRDFLSRRDSPELMKAFLSASEGDTRDCELVDCNPYRVGREWEERLAIAKSVIKLWSGERLTRGESDAFKKNGHGKIYTALEDILEKSSPVHGELRRSDWWFKIKRILKVWNSYGDEYGEVILDQLVRITYDKWRRNK